MVRTEAVARLRAHREALYRMGIEHVALFGSTVADGAHGDSDLSLAVRLRPDVRPGRDFFTLDERVGTLVGVAVDTARIEVPLACAAAELALEN